MKPPVYVAGLGVISAIGNNTAENFQCLKSGQSGIGKIEVLQTKHQLLLPAAEVKLTNAQLQEQTGFGDGISRTAMLSLTASQEAVLDAGILFNAGLRTGFVSSSTVGGMDKTEAFFKSFAGDYSKGRLRDVVNHECGNITTLVADKLGIKHHVSTVSTACSSSANAISYGARLIKNNLVDVVVAGGTDAFTRFTLNGFNTLMNLDQQPCKPFDENRHGLNLGEGAAYLVLVSEKAAAALRKKPYCVLSGHYNANDAHHQTASSPEGNGSFYAMQGALNMSSIAPGDISYINLHGTGTQNNDASEGTAVTRLFGPHYPLMSSTKSFTGHTLAASAAIEAVFSVLAISKGVVYPNLNMQTPIAAFPFSVEKDIVSGLDVRHVLSNSLGFGGNCSSLIFSKI